MWLCVPVLLAALGQPALAQSAIEGALAATVTIETFGPDGQGQGHGSGFVTSSNGTIVTAAHVIAGATSAIARFQNGVELDVEGVIDVDWSKDFAIVRVAGFDLPTVGLGNADDLSVGQRVIVIGAPIDPTLAGTVSDGLVAAIRMMEGTRHIQISAPASPGNSGGPVMTEQGQVIGVLVSGMSGAEAQNLNFALSINYVRGQLALAAARPLRPLAEVQQTVVAVSDGTSTRPSTGVAYYGDVNLDERFSPDPYELSVSAGGSIDVDLGDGECDYGYAGARPDLNLRYATTGGANLYLYVNGAEDTTLLVNQPDGTWVCDDDDLGNRNPLLVIPTAAGGLYNIWVGTFGTASTSATLFVSERDPR